MKTEKEAVCKNCGHTEFEHRYRGGCDGIIDEVIAFYGNDAIFSLGQCSCARFVPENLTEKSKN